MGLIDRPDADPVEEHAGFRALVEGLLEANLEPRARAHDR